ncbi:hypothetical protein RIB2604_01800150 [Aspergillus luchuensis]|uniref:Uncharacterized protein n=1 Tax=Aspergillus kawachii TaxID=1069201 RepID=A0A146FFU2_ASPKA|nr:hypothetical protein RIB2604_01800150 [Aspergillus luchuensis]
MNIIDLNERKNQKAKLSRAELTDAPRGSDVHERPSPRALSVSRSEGRIGSDD